MCSKCKSYSYFFSKNINIYAIFNDQSFNDMLTISLVLNNWAQVAKLICSNFRSMTRKYGARIFRVNTID